MLNLKNITKDYRAGSTVVHALKGVSLCFRKSEFVSILGPSGCGKTTLLNIIGGLDQYTNGDLIINGRSTKDYYDRDWDSYRNHSVGFVFQSYNLIPHQTVLQNVELALSLSGVSKNERRKKAKAALERVGLGDQLKKRPSEMSGGQMQRVAIARAIVNDPDIILADEPTGALDSETSLQVMEILKEISADRLVIMVTHNPEIAEKYSTRIVRMLDGVILNDSMPLKEEDLLLEEAKLSQKNKKKKTKKPSMSFATSFGLSLKNLFTKKGRTLLTSFAGSIGIIGIALVVAVSQGLTTYIDTVQEETLTSYPISIKASELDLTTLMETFMGTASDSMQEHPKDKVYSQAVLFKMINAYVNMENTENDLVSFKKYIDQELQNKDGKYAQALSGVQYTYDMDLQVFTKNKDGKIVLSDTQEILANALRDNLGMDMTGMLNMSENLGFSPDSSAMSMMPGNNSANLWTEMLSGKDGSLISPLLEKQYDLVYGSWPNQAEEIVLVLNKNNELDDLTLYALGLKSEKEISDVFKAVMEKQEVDDSLHSWTYEEICALQFRVVFGSDCYTYDEASGLYRDLRETDSGMKYLFDKGMDLKVSGIIRPNKDATSTMLKGSIGYTKALTEYIIEHSKDSAAVEAQLKNKDTDIFTGLPFKATTGELSDKEKQAEFERYISALSEQDKAKAYIDIMSIPSKEQLDAAIAYATDGVTREQIEATMTQVLVEQMGMEAQQITEYTASMSDEELEELYLEMVEEQVRATLAAEVQTKFASVPPAQLVAMLTSAMEQYTPEQFATYYDEVLEFSESTYDKNLRELGYVSLDDPASVNLFAASFDNKDVIEEMIANYNSNREELSQIRYTDYFGIMMSFVTTVLDAITYVLIAFISISLVVSSIMIGVITLISVQERTKEIGILRAIGASKRNVSGMFNAETVIIGFSSGLFGVLVTYLLCIPINLIIQHYTGINNLSAFLPIPAAFVLILISVLLTLVAGVIPSRSAAKKDPVVALRTE